VTDRKPQPSRAIVAVLVFLGIAGVALFLRYRHRLPLTPTPLPPPTAAVTPPQPPPTEPPPPLPPIPAGTTDAKRALAAAAADLRQGIRDLGQAKSNSELVERRQRLQDRSRTLAAGGADALPALEVLLADPRPDVRVRAVAILSELQCDLALDLLGDVVRHDASKAPRTAALMYLAEAKATPTMPKEVIQAKTKAARLAALADPDPDVRKLAQQAQWALCQRLDGYQFDAPDAARAAALAKLQAGP
jgi:hypothetical protein